MTQTTSSCRCFKQKNPTLTSGIFYFRVAEETFLELFSKDVELLINLSNDK